MMSDTVWMGAALDPLQPVIGIGVSWSGVTLVHRLLFFFMMVILTVALVLYGSDTSPGIAGLSFSVGLRSHFL